MIDTESTLATRTQNKQIDCGALQHKLQTMIATKSTRRLQAQKTHETNNKQRNFNQRTTMANTRTTKLTYALHIANTNNKDNMRTPHCQRAAKLPRQNSHDEHQHRN
jgi:hypothetical protein